MVFVPSLTPATRFPARQAGVFVMAFGMEHYFHHKYHSHAEAAHDHKEDVKVDMAKVDAALPAAAAAATANVTIALPTAPDLVALAWGGADGQTLGAVGAWSRAFVTPPWRALTTR